MRDRLPFAEAPRPTIAFFGIWSLQPHQIRSSTCTAARRDLDDGDDFAVFREITRQSPTRGRSAPSIPVSAFWPIAGPVAFMHAAAAEHCYCDDIVPTIMQVTVVDAEAPDAKSLT